MTLDIVYELWMAKDVIPKTSGIGKEANYIYIITHIDCTWYAIMIYY